MGREYVKTRDDRCSNKGNEQVRTSEKGAEYEEESKYEAMEVQRHRPGKRVAEGNLSERRRVAWRSEIRDL